MDLLSVLEPAVAVEFESFDDDGEVTKVLYSMSVDRAEELAELLRDSAAAARRGSLEP